MRLLSALVLSLVGLSLAGCLQRVNEDGQRLDARFLSGATLGGSHVPANPSDPFPDHDGEWVVISGEIKAETDNPIEIDVVAPSQHAGEARTLLGKIPLAAPGPFEVRAPVSFGKLHLEIYQDAASDGPDSTDFYALVVWGVEDENVEGMTVVLIEGARPEPGQENKPFAGWTGDWVALSGQIESTLDFAVVVDFWGLDKETLERTRLGRAELDGPGDFEFDAPAGFGTLDVEFYQDAEGNGPSDDDLAGRLAVEVGDLPVGQLEVTLVEGGRASMGGANKAAPNSYPPPFEEYFGETGHWVTVRGELQSAYAGPILLDLWALDPGAPGVRKRVGTMYEAGPGEFEFEAPQAFGGLQLEAYQDLADDGPSEDDRYGTVTVEVEYSGMSDVLIELEEGARSDAGEGRRTEPFAGYDGEMVALVGQISGSMALPVFIDVWRVDPNASGKRELLGTIEQRDVTTYMLWVPRGAGTLALEFFQDPIGDGPSDDDPFALLRVDVASEKVDGLDVELVAGARQSVSEAAKAIPFENYSGAMTTLSGEVFALLAQGVAMDVWKVAPDNPGRRRLLGTFVLEGTGAFSARVPSDLGHIALEFHQDISGDGPTNDDPFAMIKFEVLGETISDLEARLEYGAREQLGRQSHHEAAPGAPHDGMGAALPAPGGGEAPVHLDMPTHRQMPPGAPMEGGGDSEALFALDPCKEVPGPRVHLKGEIIREAGPEAVDIDIFQVDAEGPGGRVYLCKTKRRPGPFELEVPSSKGALLLEAFLDRDADGPSSDDPFVACPCNPVDPMAPPAEGLRFEFKL